jgi:serine/threonine protein kinase
VEAADEPTSSAFALARVSYATGVSAADDELAHKATAPDTPSAAPRAEPLVGALGRYRLERVLGEGGMGVVHAAFDPALERRVALKVLRNRDDDGEQRERLMREARAMARLTHANVVTVHEVGSADGRDYVAMELVDGETLAEWLRTPRPPAEIVAAFVAAGRGLAAAHAAGLVHRDFKPNNVLRRRDGRICVTDFGLARGVDLGASPLPLDVTQPSPAIGVEHRSSSLAGITATGTLLGTPAYMAPEQWLGGTVGPAADQFAFCVALWEALTGERPFRGQTIAELKLQAVRGPDALDASKLARRLRVPLCRGLEPDPAKRWPSMDALLAAIAPDDARPHRRRGRMFVFAALGLIGFAAYVVFGRPARNTVEPPACEASALDPASVWSSERAAAFAGAGRADIADAFARDFAAWQAGRERACARPLEQRAAALACLDGVLERFKAVARAVEDSHAELTADAVIGRLAEPRICEVSKEVPTPPRLALRASPDAVAAIALDLATDAEPTPDSAAIKALADRLEREPCERSIALQALAHAKRKTDVPGAREAITAAVVAAEACRDDRLQADALLAAASYDVSQGTQVGTRGRDAAAHAKNAVALVQQPDLLAQVELQHAMIAGGDERWDEAFAAYDSAITAFGKRGRAVAQATAAFEAIQGHFVRCEAGDLEAVRAVAATWEPVATAQHADRLRRSFEMRDALARFYLGDVAGAHAEMVAAYRPEPHDELPHQHIAGIVVDTDGKPVAGATVAVDTEVILDSIGIFPFWPQQLQTTVTDSAGTYELADAPLKGGLVAVSPRGLATIQIAPRARPVLAPTRRLAGRVQLGTRTHTAEFVYANATISGFTFTWLSPIGEDGSFAIEGAPTVELRVGTNVMIGGGEMRASVTVPSGTRTVDHISLGEPNSERTLDVVVRSTLALPLDHATVYLLPGHPTIHTRADLVEVSDHDGVIQQITASAVSQPPPSGIGATSPGDLIARFTHVQPGELTACAFGLTGDLQDPAMLRKLEAHPAELAVQCARVRLDDRALTIETSPQKRLD